MIREELRQAILLFHQQDMPIRQIARKLELSRNTVRNTIRQLTKEAGDDRDPQLLVQIEQAFADCGGNAVRIVELMEQRHGVALPYSTLTRIIREANLRKPKQRTGRYTFEPGQEMQHDTSPHRLKLGDKPITAQCASLVLAYSRMVYIQYYPCFTRFEAKTFLDGALRFFGGSCAHCMIDNTHVVLARGSGADAVIAPEMAAFGRIYGFEFRAHSIGNPNRKAHVERSFHYVENNFLAGRSFRGWKDLNQQALDWCRQTANIKIKRTLGTTPETALIIEAPHLIKLPAQLPPVYLAEDRIVDTEGYVLLDTNRYSVPERLIGKTVRVHKQSEHVAVFFNHQQIAYHPRLIGKRNDEKTEPGHHKSLHSKNRQPGACDEERQLLGRNKLLDCYINELKSRVRGRGVTAFRRLLSLQRTYPEDPFMAAIKQAQTYGMYDLARLEQMILKQVAGDIFQLD